MRWLQSSMRAAAIAAPVAAASTEEELVLNWSGTHSCRPSRVYTPETVGEAAAIMSAHASTKRPLRPCGSTLSPNGVGFCREGEAMVNMALCDAVEVDAKRMLARVQAGARVDQVLEVLGAHGLTLENLASIAAQQIGGYVQVGAHGTGATLPPVDEQCVAYRLATPVGERDMRPNDPAFGLCRVGLGTCGLLTEVTLRCVPKHLLRERIEVMTRAEVKRRHAAILRDNRHARLMWLPHVDAVVCVTNNPTFPPPLGDGQGTPSSATEAERLEPLRALLVECREERGLPPEDQIETLNFAELRDELLRLDPLRLDHVRRVNQAEAEFWRRSQGVDVADSSRKLNFDCGGQQWVNECCFPAGGLADPSGADIAFMLDLLALIEAEGIPAPAPIEQRWTASSTSPMSPAAARPGEPADSIFSWVGIIMYLPAEDPQARAAITRAFETYKRRCETLLWPRYGAVEHWAKIEQPVGAEDRTRVQARLAARFPTADFAAVRRRFDPDAILTNDLLDAVLPRDST